MPEHAYERCWKRRINERTFSKVCRTMLKNIVWKSRALNWRAFDLLCCKKNSDCIKRFLTPFTFILVFDIHEMTAFDMHCTFYVIASNSILGHSVCISRSTCVACDMRICCSKLHFHNRIFIWKVSFNTDLYRADCNTVSTFMNKKTISCIHLFAQVVHTAKRVCESGRVSSKNKPNIINIDIRDSTRYTQNRFFNFYNWLIFWIEKPIFFSLQWMNSIHEFDELWLWRNYRWSIDLRKEAKMIGIL